MGYAHCSTLLVAANGRAMITVVSHNQLPFQVLSRRAAPRLTPPMMDRATANCVIRDMIPPSFFAPGNSRRQQAVWRARDEISMKPPGLARTYSCQGAALSHSVDS